MAQWRLYITWLRVSGLFTCQNLIVYTVMLILRKACSFQIVRALSLMFFFVEYLGHSLTLRVSLPAGGGVRRRPAREDGQSQREHVQRLRQCRPQPRAPPVPSPPAVPGASQGRDRSQRGHPQSQYVRNAPNVFTCRATWELLQSGLKQCSINTFIIFCACEKSVSQ